MWSPSVKEEYVSKMSEMKMLRRICGGFYVLGYNAV
jgi:hypothetical protein